MDQPPLNLSAVDQSQAHPTYKTSLKLFQDVVRLEPSPLVKNPAVTQVQAEMKDIRPNFGEIVQGVLSGSISDYKTTLKDYSAKLTAERDRAVKAVAAQGTKVSTDDWVFPNWDLTKDFTSEFYK
jgi:multiple sugar transport system substrate-binding protein